MNKTLSFVALIALLTPALAGAQTLPTPPTPPAPPAPPARLAPRAPLPPLPPTPPAIVIPELTGALAVDAQMMQERAQELRERALASIDVDRMKADAMRLSSDQAREAANMARFEADMARSMSGLYTMPAPFDFEQQTMSTAGARGDAERSNYDAGQSALSQRKYDQAIARFDQAIAAKGSRTDGALYWKAFAQFKLGRSTDANATLDELQKSFKESKYASDAKALEAEIKRNGGQAARPEAEDDEDLKLLALQGLINSDPERAIPLVQGVLTSAGSLKLKDRALFVLAQSASPQAHTVLVNYAKGGTPDLQVKAINYLGFNRGREGGKTAAAELTDIYNSTQNDDVKRAILRAFGSAGNIQSIMTLGGSAQNYVLRSEAINQLGSAQAGTELWSMYQKETNKDLKMQILSTLGSMGAFDRVIEVAKSEKEPDLRNRAIRSLGNMRGEKSGAALVEIYGSLSDVDAKKSVISGLQSQQNGEALVQLARKETNFDLKKRMVEVLSGMTKNQAAKDYMMEILKIK